MIPNGKSNSHKEIKNKEMANTKVNIKYYIHISFSLL